MSALRRILLFCLMLSVLSTTLHGQEGIPADIIQRLKDATVFVKIEIGPLKMSGSGFVIEVTGDTALIVTNQHVIAKPKELRQGSYIPGLRGRDRLALMRIQQALATAQPSVSVVFNSGNGDEQIIKAEIIGGLEEPDLAILKVSGISKPPKPISFRKPAPPVETMSLWMLGFPFGDALSTNKGNPSITIGKGSISSVRKDEHGKLAKIQIDGALNPGNSGGPVVDSKGNLVGIAVQTIQGSNIGLAIPPHELSSLLDGRVGTPTVVVGKSEKGSSPKYEVVVPVIDPMKKLKSVSLHYVDGARTGGTPLQSATGSQKVSLTINGNTAKADLPLSASIDQKAREITVQAELVNAEGKTINLDPVVVKVSAPVIASTNVTKEGNSTTYSQTTKNPNGSTSQRQVTISRGSGSGPSKMASMKDDVDDDEKEVVEKPAKKSTSKEIAGKTKSKPKEEVAEDGTEEMEEMEEKPAKKSHSKEVASKGKSKPKEEATDDEEMDEKPAKPVKKSSSKEVATKGKSSSKANADDEKTGKKAVIAWTNKISKMKNIPDEEVKGKLDGLEFIVDKATLSATGLVLEMREGDRSTGEIHLFLFAANEDVSGKRIVVNGRVQQGDPHIHYLCKRTDGTPQSSGATLEYCLILEFGEYDAEDRVQPGKIYLCLPDRAKSFIAGTFEANVR